MRFLFLILVMTSCISSKPTKEAETNSGSKSVSADDLRAALPRMSHDLDYAKFLFGESTYVKQCDYIGEFSGLHYYEAIHYLVGLSGDWMAVDYSILRSLDTPNANANCDLFSMIEDFTIRTVYSITAESSYDGLMIINSAVVSSEADFADANVLNVLNDASFNGGSDLCDVDWSAATINVAEDVLNSSNCKIDVAANGSSYNYAYLDNNFGLRLGKLTSEYDGSSLLDLPVELEPAMGLYGLDYQWGGATSLPAAEIDLFMSQQSVWLDGGGSCSGSDLTFETSYQWDDYPNGTYREVYTACDDSATPLFIITYDVEMNLEDQLSSTPLSYNFYLDVSSASLEVVSVTGATRINTDSFCNLSGVSDDEIHNVLNASTCSLMSAGVMYSQIIFEVNSSGASISEFDDADGKLGSSSADRFDGSELQDYAIW